MIANSHEQVERAGGPRRGPKAGLRSLTLRESLLVAGIMVGAALLHGGAVTAPFFSDDYLFVEPVRGRSVWQALSSVDPIGNPVTSEDSTRAVALLLSLRSRAGLAPQVHARLAALCLSMASSKQLGVIEAFAFTRLSPRNPDAWRKWAAAQLAEGRHGTAARSLEHSFALGGAIASQDLKAKQVLASLRRVVSDGGIP